MQKADELASFKFGEYDETVITGKDIDSRELILVIPENPLNEKQQLAIDECYKYVSEISIIMSVKRYQNAPIPVTVQQEEPWADVEQIGYIWYNYTSFKGFLHNLQGIIYNHKTPAKIKPVIHK